MLRQKSNIYLRIKRIIDFCIAFMAMPFLGLFLFVCSICIKVDDGGSIFYIARRTGFKGKPFKMIKLRSMKPNAPDIRLEDDSTFNSSDDPRVTKFGKFARKTSIDEIPQIINVLLGDMSFVGPRPNSVSYYDRYTEKEKRIFTVRPGITGYNQVINRNSVGTKEKLKNDIYYVDHMSFLFDMKIVLKTIKVVLSKKNVYRVDEGN